MKTALLVLTLVPALVACGPLPGYYPEDEVPGAATPPPKPPPPSAPRGLPPSPPPAANSAPNSTAPTGPGATRETARGILVVKTGSPDMRYLIDTQRRVCFFQTRAALTTVPCSSIPEAAAALDTSSGQPQGGTASPSPSPAPTSPARLAPEPAPGPPPSPDAAPGVPPKPSDPRAAPAVSEREHFERAYVQIFCDRRAGNTTEPAARIQAEGLTVERYTAIESWAARDERIWRELTRKAVLNCAQR